MPGLIQFRTIGNFEKTIKFLKTAESMDVIRILKECGDKGLANLRSATPIDTGLSASSWSYTISTSERGYILSFNNSDTTPGGVPIVVLIHYGHAVGDSYVEGVDFINPALRPIFNQIVDDLVKKELS